MSADPTRPPEADAEAAPAAPSPWVNLALELGPVVLFFVVYKLYGIYAATGLFMVTSIVAMVVTWLREHRVKPIQVVTAVLVLVFGGITIWLQDDTFIKVKFTIVNGLLGATLVVGLLLGKPLIKAVIGEALKLTDEGWTALTRIWAGYFLGLAAANEVVWRTTSTDTWVNFKTFVPIPVLLVLMIFLQAPVIAKHELSERESEA